MLGNNACKRYAARLTLTSADHKSPRLRGQTLPKRTPMKASKTLLILTEWALAAYWTAVILSLIPLEWQCKHYSNPIIQAWNGSFLPLDLLAVIITLSGLPLNKCGVRHGEIILTTGLTLTFTASFMAISLWVNYGSAWWLPNITLMLIPLTVLAQYSCQHA